MNESEYAAFQLSSNFRGRTHRSTFDSSRFSTHNPFRLRILIGADGNFCARVIREREKFQVQKIEILKFFDCQPLVECQLSIVVWTGHLCIEL